MDPHRQDLLESSFVTSLVLKLNPHQIFSINSFCHDENSLALLSVSSRRINATVALLEKNIVFNSKTIFSNNDDITDEVGYFMHLLCEVLVNYVEVKKRREDVNNDVFEVLSDVRCHQLVASLTHTYVEVFENWKDVRYERLEPLCGKLFRILSSVSQGPVLENVSELMLRYASNSSSAHRTHVSTNFAPLRVLKYLEFNFKGMISILTVLSNIITEPQGGWKKMALLEISIPLKIFISSWMSRETTVLRDLYLGKIDSAQMLPEDVKTLYLVVGKILSIMELWTSAGIRKRTVLWPTMCLLTRLVPDDLAKAVLIEDMTKSSLKGSATVDVIARLLRAISKNFRPSKIASVLQTDAVTLSEISVIFLVEYLQTSALIKSCNRGVAKYVSPQLSSDGATASSMLRGSMSRYAEVSDDLMNVVSSTSADARVASSDEMGAPRESSFSLGRQHDFIERYFYPYDMFFLNHKDRLEAMLMTGLHPSLLYYSSLEHALEHSSAVSLGNSEYTPSSLLASFLWSLYFLEAESFLKLCNSSLSQLAAQTTRLGTIEAIARVLGNSSLCHASAAEFEHRSSPTLRKRKEFSRGNSVGKTTTTVVPLPCADRCTKHRTSTKIDLSIVVNPFWSYGASCQVKSRVLGLIVAYARSNIRLLSTEAALCKLVSQVLISTSYHFNYDAEVGPNSVDLPSALLSLRLVADNPNFVLVRNIDVSRRGTVEEGTTHQLFPTTFVAYLCLLLGDFCSLLIAKDMNMSDAAGSAIVAVIRTDTIRLWNTKGAFSGLLCVSSFLLIKLALLLGSYDSDNSAQTVRVFRILRHLLHTVNDFLVHAEDEATFQMADMVAGLVSFRTYAVNIVESSIVLHLCSNDADISNLSAQCLGLLCINHDLIEGQDYSSSSWNIHRQISDPSMQLLMPADRQKTVRNLLGSTSAKSLGVRWALLVVRSRWEELSKVVKTCTDTFAVFTQFEEWSNYSSFLCALADGLGEASNPESTLMALVLKVGGSGHGLQTDASHNESPFTGMPILSHADENSRLIRANFVAKEILEELLSLIVFNSSGTSDKKISQNAFLSIGMYLSDSFITPLFELLSKLLQVFDTALSNQRAKPESGPASSAHAGSNKHTRASVSSSAKDSGASHSSSLPIPFAGGGIDFNACGEMSMLQIMSTMNALLTMLEMIFERQWYNKVDFSSTNMEEILLKLVAVVCKIHGFQPANDPIAGNGKDRRSFSIGGLESRERLSLNPYNPISPGLSPTGGPSGSASGMSSSGLHARGSISSSEKKGSPHHHHGSSTHHDKREAIRDDLVSLGDELRLKKKVALMVHTYLKNRPNVYITNSFCMCVGATFMKWVYDCVNVHFVDRDVEADTGPSTPGPRRGLDSRVDPASLPAVATINTNVLLSDLEMYRTAEFALMQTMVLLFDGIQIIPEEIEAFPEEVVSFITPDAVAGGGDEGPSQNTATLGLEKRSQVFFKFFAIISTLLRSCDESTLSGIYAFHLESFGSSRTVLAAANAHINGNLTEVCLDVLTNLFDANVMEGFVHISDSSTTSCRSDGLQLAYLHVFNRVLSRQGVHFGHKSAGDEDNVTHSYEDVLLILRQMITSETDDTLRMTLCSSVQATKDAELLSSNLMIVCANRGPSLGPGGDLVAVRKLLEQLIPLEVASTVRLGSLFRNETICTKLMGLYFHAIGKEYLASSLVTPIQNLLAECPDLEVDPARMQGGSAGRDVEENCIALQTWSKEFLKSLLAAVSCLPDNIKRLLRIVSQESTKKFGQQKASVSGCDRISVGGYFFLRFVCPAIALPVKYGVLFSSVQQPISKQNSRSLLLVVKVLQNLANGTQFTEECMLGINRWIEEHDVSFVDFCTEISTPDALVVPSEVSSSSASDPAAPTVAGEERVVDEEVYDALTKIHAYMFRQKAALLKLVEETAAAAPKDDGVGGEVEVNAAPLGSIPANPVNAPVAIGELIKLPLEASFRVLLKHLGDPVEKSDDKGSGKYGLGVSSGAASDRNAPGFSHFPSECLAFLAATEAKPGFRARYAALQKQKIFFCLGLPREATFMFVLRRVEATTDMFLLLYSFVKVIHRALLSKIMSFDLVIDSTAFNFESALEPFTLKKWWEKCKKFFDKVMSNYLRKVYVLYPSKELADMSRRVLKVWGIKSQVAAQVSSVVTPSVLCEKLPHLLGELAHSMAMKVEVGTNQRWSCTRHSKVVDVCFSNRMVLLESTDSFSGIKYKRTDMIPLHLIDSVVCGNVATELMNTLADTTGAIMNSNPALAAQQFAAERLGHQTGSIRAQASSLVSGLLNFDTVIVSLSWHARSFRLHSNNAKGLEQAFLGALALVRQQTALEEVVKLAGAKSCVSVPAMPGTLLFVSIYNLFGPDEAVRRSAYVLLCLIKECFLISLDMPLHAHDSVSLPVNPLPFAYSVCAQIAVSRPGCVYEFLFSCVAAIKSDKIEHSRRIACIMCMRPWLPALTNLILTMQQHEEAAASRKNVTPPVTPGQEPSETPSLTATSPATALLAALKSPLPASQGAQEETTPAVATGTVGVTFGGRVFDTRLDDVVARVLDMFDAVLTVYCEDSALQLVLSSEFWSDIGNDPKLTAYALKLFITKWMVDVNTPSAAPTGENSTDQGIGVGRNRGFNSMVADPLVASLTQNRCSADSGSFSGPSFAGKSESFSSRMPQSPGRSGSSKALKAAAPLVSQRCYSMCIITAILAQTQPTLVSSLLLNKAIRLINQPYQTPTTDRWSVFGPGVASPGLESLSMEGDNDQPKEYWLSIAALFRPMLFLPFQNHQMLAARIPDLFHLVVLLVTRGPSNLRAGVHGLTCSILHSLIAIVSNDPTALSRCVTGTSRGAMNAPLSVYSPTNACTSPGPEPDESTVGAPDINVSVLRSILDQLCSTQFHYIFYEAPSMTLNHLELLVRTLGDVVMSTNSLLCEKWRKRWWKIAMATAMDTLPSPASARCFVTLATLIRPSDIVATDASLSKCAGAAEDNSVFLKVFEALKASITADVVCSGDNYLMLYMLRTFTKLVPFMKKQLLCSVFWISVACMHLSTSKSFPEAFRLFACVVQELLVLFPTSLLENVLMDFRRENDSIDALLSGFEETIGISFCTPRRSQMAPSACSSEGELEDSLSFTYAVTLTLLAGFSIPSLRDEVVVLLDRLARHYVEAIPASGSSGLSGYAVVLFCFVTNRADMFPLHKRGATANATTNAAASLTRTPSSMSNSGQTAAASNTAIINAYNTAVNFSSANPHLDSASSLRPKDGERDPALGADGAVKHEEGLYTPDTFPNEQVGILYVVTLLIALDKVEEDQGKVHACELLLEVLASIPQTVVDMHDVVFAELMRMYHEIKNRRPSEAILAVMGEYFRLEDAMSLKAPSGDRDIAISGIVGAGGDMSARVSPPDDFVHVEAEDVTVRDSLLQRTLLPTSAVQFRRYSGMEDPVAGDGDAGSISESPARESTDYSSAILSDYMQPPPTPSNGALDSLGTHRNLTITATPVKAVKPTGRNSDAQGRLTPNSSTGVSGFALLKDIGFAEMLYVACFDKKPSCQPSNRIQIANTLVGLITIFMDRLKQPVGMPVRPTTPVSEAESPPPTYAPVDTAPVNSVPGVPAGIEGVEAVEDLASPDNEEVLSVVPFESRFADTKDTEGHSEGGE